MEGKVLALETEIEGFQRLIKSLQNEKDELMGKNQALEQEKELYKVITSVIWGGECWDIITIV